MNGEMLQQDQKQQRALCDGFVDEVRSAVLYECMVTAVLRSKQFLVLCCEYSSYCGSSRVLQVNSVQVRGGKGACRRLCVSGLNCRREASRRRRRWRVQAEKTLRVNAGCKAGAAVV